jgi:hypothetical protein
MASKCTASLNGSLGKAYAAQKNYSVDVMQVKIEKIVPPYVLSVVLYPQ